MPSSLMAPPMTVTPLPPWKEAKTIQPAPATARSSSELTGRSCALQYSGVIFRSAFRGGLGRVAPGRFHWTGAKSSHAPAGRSWAIVVEGRSAKNEMAGSGLMARDRSYLKVSADLPEEDIPVVVRGAPCEIRTSGYCAFTCWKNTSSSEWVWPEMGLSGLTGSVIWLRVSPQAA